MATVTKAYVSSNVLVGPAEVFVGIPAPASASPPTQANEVALDANGQPATATGTITAATNATPIVCTIASTNLTFGSSTYQLVNGDIVVISGAVGNTGANGTWTISSVSATGFTLNGSSGNGVWSSGGTVTVGQHMGLTEGPTSFTITPKFEEIRADQFESPIDAALTTVEAELDISFKEFDVLKLQRLFTADTLSNPQVLANSSVTQIGGQFTDSDNLRTFLLVSPDRKTVGKWIYVLGFKAYLKSALQTTFHRTATNIYKLKFGLVADFTRVAGDEICNVVRTK